MRILHVTHSMDPARGGPPAVVARLAAAQAAAGHEVTIFAGEVAGTQAAVGKSLAPIPYMGLVKLRTVGLPESIGTLLLGRARGLAGVGALDEAVAASDFVHVHEVWPVIVPLAARACGRLGRAYCVTPHSSLNTWGMGQRRLKKRLALEVLGWRGALNGARFLHMLNVAEVEQARPLGLRAACEIMPNGVFVEEMTPLPERGSFRASVRGRAPGLGERRFILFLSRLHFKKGLDILSDAFAVVARERGDVDLVVAGPDGGEEATVRRRAREAGLEGRVHVVGPVYGKEKFGAYVDASVFCLPSRMEGFSMAITESLACGTPVVISGECNFPEVAHGLEGRGCGVVTGELTANATASGLLSVLGDEASRVAMGAAGAAMVRARYTWPAIAARSVELYGRYG
jgi:glycosyltransferase involved in cell wall biosynthesis